MEFKSKHLLPQPRRFRLHPPVSSIGYVPHKTDWIRRTFPSVNFSFILSGGGEYRVGGQSWKIAAPCVITQVPDVPVEYGPAQGWTEWEELYLIYPPESLKLFHQAGLDFARKPFWQIRDSAPVLARLRELSELLQAEPMSPGTADRIDQACQALVLESLLGESAPPRDPHEILIHRIREDLRQRFREAPDFHSLARRHGLSFTSFRRHWNRHVDCPPARYLMRLRLREACRLLVETAWNVAEIAYHLGFRDPLYFSRRFHTETGLTATAYRTLHQVARP